MVVSQAISIILRTLKMIMRKSQPLARYDHIDFLIKINNKKYDMTETAAVKTHFVRFLSAIKLVHKLS